MAVFLLRYAKWEIWKFQQSYEIRTSQIMLTWIKNIEYFSPNNSLLFVQTSFQHNN